MLTLQAGPDGVRNPGSVHDMPPTEAEELIAGGYAVKVENEKAVEAEPIVETADREPKSGASKAVKTK